MIRRLQFAVVLSQLLCAAAAWADITNASLEIQGVGLRVETVSVTTGADIPTTIQTSFAGKTNDEAPAVNGLLAVGELTGPGIEVPIQLTATPGYRFHIPGLPRLGDYYLQNIRLMSGNDVLQPATPSLAKITVADLLQTSLSVKQLTPEQIRERGIIVDGRNYDVYEYTFTFLVNGEKVEVPFPVIIDPRTHAITPVVEEKDYGLPNPVKNVQPPRWTPPDIVPFEFPDLSSDEIPDPGKEPPDKKINPSRPRIPAALVIPSSLAVLHQFFAVMLTVQNGAPTGSTARLEDVNAQLKIKVPSALRAVKSTPSVAFGQAVPVVDPNTGVTVLIAQSKGEAEWVLEGLKPGTHTVEVDITATLREEGQREVYLRATPSASVIIHDPRFNITFSHPDTVRKGLDYSTYAFITNMSPQTQTIRVTDGLPTCTDGQFPNVCRVSGGPPPADMTIPAGEMKVVEYRLRAGETGQIYATAGTINDETITAAVQLHMGVSASGIPLSPATLVLPYYAQFIDQGLVGDYLQLLGLGYSLATAPLNQTTAKFPRVIKTDVFYRANDIARAGQRIFISNANAAAQRDALSNLLLDLLGNSIELREWDELRRKESSGRTAGASLVAQLRASLIASQSSIGAALDGFASDTAHRDPYVVAIAHGPTGATRPVSIAIRGVSGRTASGANELTEGWKRDLAFADVSRFDAFDRMGELAAAGRWTEDLELVLTPHVSGPFEVDVLYPGTNDGTTMRARLVVTGEVGVPIRLPLTRGATTLNALLPNGGFIASAIGNAVPLPPITLFGARQDLHLDKEGHKVSVLFSRPVTLPQGVDLLTKFAGKIDFNRDDVVFKDARHIFAAALQGDQRVVTLSFDHVLSTNASYTIDVGSFVDPATTNPVSFPDPVIPKIDNDRPAGILYGKFITGANVPIAGAEIKFFTGHHVGCARDELRVGDELGLACNPFREAPQYAKTLTDGSFLFEYVPRDVIADPLLTGLYKAVGVTPEGRATVVEGSVRLPGRVHYVNLQLLGRGSAEGRVKYDNGEVAGGVKVHVSSTMFNVGRDATTNAEGYFRVDDLAVGPITFGAQDEAGNVAFASGEIATPGQVVTKDIVIYRKPFPGTGTVYGRVTRSDTGGPVFGARVGVYSQGYGLSETSTDSDGRFEFTKVPSGFVTLLAAEWSIARENAAADFDLRADETKEMNLVLAATPSDMQFVRVTGKVLRENPLYPGDPTKYERVPGAVVNLAILTTTADANGEWAFDGVPIIAGDPSNAKTIRAYDPSTKRFATTPVPTLSATQPNDVTVFIPANSYGGGTVRVRVVNAHGVPADGFRVIEPGFPPTNLVRVGAALYEYRNAPIGYTIDVMAVDGPENYGEQVASGEIRLDFPGQTATLVLRLPGQGTVRTKLRGDFDLIGDVAITYPVWSEPDQMMDKRTVLKSTSENGIAGFATFTAIPALHGYHVASAHPVYGYADANGNLAFDGDVTLHTLQLNKLSVVKGVVYAIDGVTPVAGAAVRLYDGRRDAGILYTQPDGSFVFHDVPAAVGFHVTAEVTQSGIYRVGIAHGRTPNLGGPAPDVPIILRRRGSVEGKVVYAEYKVYDPENPANNVDDPTPGDYSDNAPVPLARLWLRELDYPERSFGTAAEPMVADVGGRFAVNNVFIGSLRATAWATENQEMRGNWTGVLSEEGELLTPVYIAVGTGGTGSLEVKVVDPNQQYLPIANAEVRLYRGGLFDLTTTDDAGLARFEQLPVGSYGVDAYSKSLGKSGAGTGLTIAKNQTAEVRILLEFVGKVDGRLTDPMIAPALPLPGRNVKLTASNFYAIASTDTQGLFFFEGIREGSFELAVKDTESNRWAWGQGQVTPANRRPFVELELERTESLHVAVYLPNDIGGNSGLLAGDFEIDVVQRCALGLCDYRRTLQGNQLVFPNLFLTTRYNKPESYAIEAREIGGAARTISYGGVWPKGTAADPVQLVYPAFGGVEITVTQGGAPAPGVRVNLAQYAHSMSLFADSAGKVVGSGFRLGNVLVQATSVDGRFSGSATVNIARTSEPGRATIDLGAYAGVTGTVIAEGGGPSVGTRVLATFSGRTLEMVTDGEGRYLFQGIPTSVGGTGVSMNYVGPDGVTTGARRGVTLNNDWASRIYDFNAVTLDATPPQLVSVTPIDGSQNVSPDAPVRFVFSEEIEHADLTSGNLQLVAADGSGAAPATITWAMQQDKTMVVTVNPTLQAGERFPLKSNTLYRIIVLANLRDLTGHRLPAPRGFTFTTSDYAEPRVVKLVPSDKLPLSAQETLQFHFNEPVAATGITFKLYKISSPGVGGAIVAEKSGRSYVDPVNGLFLAFAPDTEIEPESFYRAVFSGVKDLQGNALAEQTFHYFSFDNVKPYVRLISPVPDGVALVSGVEYTLNVDLRNGSAEGTPATDLAAVEYYRMDGTTETYLTTVSAVPFAYRFSGPEAPEAGITLTLRAKPVDASGNEGPDSDISWTVKPNAPPKNVVVTLDPTGAYPGTTVTANVTFEDEGVLAPVQVVARGTNQNGTEYVRSEVDEPRRANVGVPWPPVAIPFALPATLKPETTTSFTATVTDVRGLSATAIAVLNVLGDTIKPVIHATTPAAETTYTLNAKYSVKATVSDAETGVAEVQFIVDGTTHRVTTFTAGANGTRVYSSPQITATARNVDTRIPIVVRVIDHHGNVAVRTFDVIYIGVNDPTAPKATWLCPVDRAVVPAAQTAYKMTLKVRAQDDVSITGVKFRITGVTDLVDAARIGTSDDYQAEATFDTPPEGADFTIAAIVSDADETHTIEVPIAIDVVTVDRVIDATEAVDFDTVQNFAGRSLLVKAPGKLVVNEPLALKNLLVVDGGRIETLGTTLGRERKLDLTVTDRIYVDCTSTIDVTARGYLGGWGVNPDGTNTKSDSPRGRTAGNVSTNGASDAGGSYGGLGGSDLAGTTNATYGAFADPFELGSGGAGYIPAQNEIGGTGGGAASLRMSEAADAVGRVVIAGTVRANGGGGRHGGSGGAIRIHARQVVIGPLAQMSANGGAGQSGCGNGASQCHGGSGGRIAVTATERLDLAAPLTQLFARGGAVGPSGNALHGAPGTIFLRRPGQTGGELHVANTTFSRATPLPALDLDRLVLGTYALARLDGAFTIGGAADDVTKIEKDPTAAYVLPGAVPTITAVTTPAPDASLIRNTPLEVLLDLATAAGVMRTEVDLSAAPPVKVAPIGGYPTAVDDHKVTFTIPPDAPIGAATLKVKVIDRADRVAEVTVANYSVIDNLAPVIDAFTALPATVYPGRSVTATVSANDDVGVTRLSVTAQIGANAPSTQTKTPNAKVVTDSTFTFTVPVTTPGDTVMTFEAAAEDGFPGRLATKLAAPNVTILKDTVAPQITITAPAADQLFQEVFGQTFTVRASIVDADVAVKSATVKVGDALAVPLAREGATNNFSAVVKVPDVDGQSIVTIPIAVTALDYENNSAIASSTIRVQPIYDPNAPVVRYVCLTNGAMYPAGHAVRLRVFAIGNDVGNGANGVTKVEFYIGDDTTTPITATGMGNNLYQAMWTIPADATDDTVFTIRAVATNQGNKTSDVSARLTIVSGTVITADTTVTDNRYDDQTVIVKSGTLTLGGARRFARFIVLENARVTHLPATNAGERVEVEAETLYIACDGGIDTTGKGYGTNRTVGDVAAGASTGHSAGSHGGRGAHNNGVANAEYGSLTDPSHPGAGGASPTACGLRCYAGGGVVRFKGTNAIVDGFLAAHGIWNWNERNGGAGAGGSIKVEAANVAGYGEIRADGGYSEGVAGGGGGRVAIVYDQLSIPRANISARGAGGYWGHLHGAPGTVYLRSNGGTETLTADNNNVAPQQPTSIQDLGSGTITAASGATLTLSGAVPEWIAGSYLELLDANGDVTAAYRITARTATTVTVANEGAVIALGTAYRGAWRFTEVVSSGRASLLMGGVTVPTLTVVSPSFMSVTEVRGSAVTLRGGSFDLSKAKVGNLTITGNASVSHPHANPDARRMTLDVANTLTIDAGSFIDASARGLGSNRTYPNTTTGASTGHAGGSHGGRGAAVSGATANEFGSLFDPDTPGGGGSNPPNCERCAAGGGVLRIKAANVVVNGKILSVGGWDWTNRTGGAGAGGSIRIDAPAISGSGEIRADGGYSEGLGGGGGGRVALYFNQLTVPRANISARGGSGYYGHQHGGAGTVYLRGPAGDQLVVDNQGYAPSQVTRLADLGSGTITAVNGAELTLSVAPPEWVIGSYLELLDATGNVTASYEITARSATGVTVRTNGDTIAAGTAYRGAWKFGEVVTAGLAVLQMQGVSTPLLTTATSGYMLLGDLRGTDVTLQGGVFVAGSAKVNNLTIANGAALTQHPTDATTVRRLTLDVAGTLTVNAGASIDVSGRGYGSLRTWDPATGAPTTTGGSTGHAGGTHAGRGAIVSGTIANEFGSLFDPDTPGGGGGRLSDNCQACNAGGGIVRIKAGNTVVNGRIYAIGAWDWTSRTGGAGAGGSIRIDAATISGSGEIRADGAYSEGLGGGGGGRLALYYDDLTVPMANISARGGSGYYGHQHGAAGTVYLKESGAPDYLLFHNGNLNPQQPSRLAELGTGTVTAASGSVLTLSNPVPDWLAGSWIELLDGSGNVAAAYEIASRTATTVTLRNGGEAVAAGTAYRGAWRFGELAATNHAYLRTAALYETPLLTTVVNGWMTIGDLRGTDVTMKGYVFELTSVKTSTLTVTGGALLTHPVPDLTSIRKVTIDTGTLTIDAGAGIEVSGRGFASLRTWNNVTAGGSTGHSGGSHGGTGAHHTGVSGQTFGSLYDPDTPGGGGGRLSDNCERCNAGGGVVRIKAGNAVLNGKIYSYGAWDWTSRTGGAGAGGSIRIDAATISGSGEIRADGAYSEGLGGGGGGRVALYYDNLTVPLANISARGGSGYYGHQHGAPGTVYLEPSAQAFGELRVINDLATSRTTRLTSVGSRIADEVGSSTLRDADASFPGPNHLIGIRVFTGSDRAKRWLVTGNTADTVTLDVAADPLVATVGGPFRGIQKFEKIVLRNAYLEIEDVLEYVAAVDRDGVSTVTGSNESAPLVDASKITLQVTATGSAIVAAAGAVADPDQPVKVFVTNTATGLTTTHTAGANGSFAAAVQGNAGDTIVLFARDSNVFPLDSATITIGNLAESTPTPTQLPKAAWTGDVNFKPQIVAVDGELLATSSWQTAGASSGQFVLMTIADAARPAHTRTVAFSDPIRDFVIEDGIAYVVGERFASLDLRNASSAFRYSTSDRSGSEQAVAVARGYAFTAENWNTDGRIHIYDVSDPTSVPKYLRTQTTAFGDNIYTDLVPYGDDYLLGISWGNSGNDLVVIDRRDIHNLVRVAVLQIPDFVAWRGNVSGRYLYLATPTKAEIAVVDLVNPAAPAVVARVPLGASSAQVTVAGDLAFVAATAAGLATTSLGPTAAVTGSATTGGNAMDVAIAAGHAYIANELGIAVLPVSLPPLIDPSKISMSLDGATGNVTITGGYRAVTGSGTVSATITNSVTNATTTVTVAADGSFAASLAASGGHALTLSATDALNRTAGPVAIGTVPFGSTATFLPIYNTGDPNYRVRTLKAEGKWLVAASDDAYSIHSSRIVVYDISNPAVPVPVRSLDNPTNIVRDVELVGGRLYTVSERFSSIDLNDPASTWSSAPSDRSGTEIAVAIAGGYAFTAEEWNTDGRIHVYDMSVVTAPRYLATHVTAGVGGNNYDDLLAYGDNYLIGISDDGGGRDVVVIDRRDVNALVRVGHLSISQIAAYRGAISGNTLYLAGNDGGVAMVDLTNPASPQLLSVSNTGGYALGVDAAGDAVFAADRGAGVVFLKKDGAALTQLGVQAVGGDAWDVVHEGSTLYVAMEQGIVVIDGVFTAPRIDTDFITLTSTGSVTGTAYAVSGAPPLSVEVRNVTTAAAMTVTAGANGSFAAALPASPGDAFTVKVTDTFGRVAGPLAIGTIPFGSSTTLIPMQGTGDGNFRARTVVAEGKWAAVGSFPAYGTSSNRIVVYDISHPAAPLQSRVLQNPGGSVRDLKIIDGWLYATADRTAWLDLNDPASNWVMAPDRSGTELAVAVAGGYLYTTEEWNTDGRIHIFDFSNRAAPRYLRTTGGLAGVGGNNFTALIPYGTDYLIAVGDGGGNRDVVVIDRRDVNNLVRVAHLSIPNFDAFRARIAGSRLFVAGGNGGVAMVDLANPASPQLLSVFDTPGNVLGVDASGSAVMATDRAFGVVFLDATTGVLTKTGTHVIGGDAWDCALAGRVLYVANEQGLVVIDNVFAPPRIEANFISVDSTGTVTGRAGAITGQAPLTVTLKNVATAATIEVTALGDGSFSALVPASAGETITVAVTDAYGRKAGPVVIGTIPFGTATKVFPITTTDANFRARTIKLEGARAVVGSFPDYGLSSAQLVVLDLTNPSVPAVSRTVADPGGATRDFELVNGWLYTVSGRLSTLNLADPASAWNVAPDSSGTELAVAVTGGYAYTAEEWNNDGRIHIYDVSDPAQPRYVTTTGGLAGAGGNNFTDLIAYGDYLLGISTGGRDLVVIDRRDGYNLFRLSHLAIPELLSFRGRVSGTTLYLAGLEGGMAVVDLANPAAPVVKSIVNTPGMAYGLDVAGSSVMVADRGLGVAFVDASTTPARYLGTHATSGDAWDVALGGTHLYVAIEQGIAVVENVPAPPDIQPTLIGIANAGASLVTVSGGARAIGGLHPLTVEVRNDATAANATVTANADGSFSTPLVAAPGQQLSIRVTDAAGRVATHVAGNAPFFSIVLSHYARDTDGAMWGRRIISDGTNIAVSGGILYGGRWNASTRMALLRPPLAPSVTFFNPGSPIFDDMEINGAYAVMAGERFCTVDYTSTTPVRYWSSVDRSGTERAVTVIGTNAYVSEAWNRNGTINVYSLADWTAPLFTTSKAFGPSNFDYYDLLSSGNYLIGISHEGSIDVSIIDTTVPTNMIRTGTLNIPSFTGYAAVRSGNTLFVTGGPAGIAVVDISNPAAPLHVTTVDTPGSARRVAMLGANRLVVADSGRGLTFIDVTNPAAPVVLGNQVLDGTATDVFVSGTDLFVAAETRFYRLTPLPE